MRCSDQWLCDKAPELHVKDIEGLVPIQKAVICKSWACLDYFVQSLPLPLEDSSVTPPILSGKMFQRAVSKNLQQGSPIIVKKVYNDKGIGLHKARDLKVSSNIGS